MSLIRIAVIISTILFPSIEITFVRVSWGVLQRIIINKISSILLSARLVWAGVAERVTMDCIRERGACAKFVRGVGS